MPHPNPEAERLLAELETTIAAAEELRYRIKVALGIHHAEASPAPDQAPEPGPEAPQRQARQPADPASQTGDSPAPWDTSNLTRTGRGLWAWLKARHPHRVAQVVEIGRAAGFPARMVEWTPAEVDQAVDALTELVAGEAPDASGKPVQATSQPTRRASPQPRRPRGNHYVPPRRDPDDTPY